jgi:aspartate kinase
MIIQKFGGTSVGGSEPIRRLGEIVKRALPRRPVVVVSAVGGVTNKLFKMSELALARGDWEREFAALSTLHENILRELALETAIVDGLLEELHGLLRGIELIRECTPRTMDYLASFGERMSARMVAAHLQSIGVDARALDAWDAGLVTDSRFGGARPLAESEAKIRAALGALESGWSSHGTAGAPSDSHGGAAASGSHGAAATPAAARVPVITGYIGKDSAGNITTLGRGGSDFSAAIFGAALAAEEIEIWTDVDGVMTADPRIVKSARFIHTLSFAEAAELAFFGAKVLHPATMVPAVQKNIPIRVKNSFRPEFEGTTVVSRLAEDKRGVKSITSKDKIAVVNIVAAPMLMQYGFLERVADVFARHEIVIDMIATSEVSLAMTTDAGARLEPVTAELAKFAEVSVVRDMALVSVVGEELKDRVDFSAIVFGALSELGVKVEMISYGATRNNLSFVVNASRVREIVSALHERLFGS